MPSCGRTCFSRDNFSLGTNMDELVTLTCRSLFQWRNDERKLRGEGRWDYLKKVPPAQKQELFFRLFLAFLLVFVLALFLPR